MRTPAAVIEPARALSFLLVTFFSLLELY